MERDFNLGLDAREFVINHLHEVLPYCLKWEREDSKRPEFRAHVANIFFSLIVNMTTTTSSGSASGEPSDLRWDGRNDDDETENLRRVQLHRAYLIAKGSGDYYRKNYFDLLMF